MVITDEALERILQDLEDGSYTEERKENGTY